jgi:hypothetical protein
MLQFSSQMHLNVPEEYTVTVSRFEVSPGNGESKFLNKFLTICKSARGKIPNIAVLIFTAIRTSDLMYVCESFN